MTLIFDHSFIEKFEFENDELENFELKLHFFNFFKLPYGHNIIYLF